MFTRICRCVDVHVWLLVPTHPYDPTITSGEIPKQLIYLGRFILIPTSSFAYHRLWGSFAARAFYFFPRNRHLWMGQIGDNPFSIFPEKKCWTTPILNSQIGSSGSTKLAEQIGHLTLRKTFTVRY